MSREKNDCPCVCLRTAHSFEGEDTTLVEVAMVRVGRVNGNYYLIRSLYRVRFALRDIPTWALVSSASRRDSLQSCGSSA